MLSMIAVVYDDNAIGKDNKLLAHLSEDLKYFKKVTTGKTMIMGRKTFESLPGILPNREHIVITNNPDFKENHPMVKVVNSVDEAIGPFLSMDAPEAFIVGGETIYRQAMPYCQKLYITRAHAKFEADTFFPDILENEWQLEQTSEQYEDLKNGIVFQFLTYLKK